MRWFKLDTNAPQDTRIRAVIREFGYEGFGVLVAIWCFVGEHGAIPGHAVDSKGRPYSIADIADAVHHEEAYVLRLLQLCAAKGHVDADEWERSGAIVFPAQVKRADEWTDRQIKAGKAIPKVRAASPLLDKPPLPSHSRATPDLLTLEEKRSDQKRSDQTRAAGRTATRGTVFAGRRWSVPSVLHEEFASQIGTSGFDVLGWYERVDAADDGSPSLLDDWGFWRKKFRDQVLPELRKVARPERTPSKVPGRTGTTPGKYDHLTRKTEVA